MPASIGDPFPQNERFILVDHEKGLETSGGNSVKHCPITSIARPFCELNYQAVRSSADGTPFVILVRNEEIRGKCSVFEVTIYGS